ncbi:MAG: hotdog fold thioesterase [Alphaproteobacteria bacterium]|nr:hotdog fold thioesterase [Alphaproteobacteria bacterium]
MNIWKRPVSLEILQAYCVDNMFGYHDIEFTEFGDDFMIARMPVTKKTHQSIGIMHGGASCVLAEAVGSIASNFCVDTDSHCSGLSINTNHIRSIASGFVYAKAQPSHLGKSTHVWTISIVDENQRLISLTTLTMVVLKNN